MLVEAEIAICPAKSAAEEKAEHACERPHTVSHWEDSAGIASRLLHLRQNCDCASCKAYQIDEAFPAEQANAS